MRTLIDRIELLRWDDHRYYHQSRINQTLHLISAISFLVAYGWIFVDPAAAGLLGWLVGMVTRQSGHLFFEPRGFDQVNGVSDEYKESVKVGYNMHRKAVLIGVWLAVPLAVALFPGGFDGLSAGTSVSGFGAFAQRVGLMWLLLGLGGVAFRCVHLCFLRGPLWSLAWALKILTDPFHNVAIYWRSPLALMRGEQLDPLIAGRD